MVVCVKFITVLNSNGYPTTYGSVEDFPNQISENWCYFDLGFKIKVKVAQKLRLRSRQFSTSGADDWERLRNEDQIETNYPNS